MDVPEHRFKIDLRIARGLDYYTGTVYETVLNDHPEIGSVCSGGRYDDLASTYTTQNLPGVGISIGLTRLFYKLREIGVITPERSSPADIVVIPLDASHIPYTANIAAILRTDGINVVHYTEPNAMKDKFRYADRMGFRYALIAGDSEAAAGRITIKDMSTGDSQTVESVYLISYFDASR